MLCPDDLTLGGLQFELGQVADLKKCMNLLYIGAS